MPAALAVCLVAPTLALARPAEATLEARLGKALHAPGLTSSLTGALAIDVIGGTVVYEQYAAKPFRPASTEKLTVSLAALDRLGPSFRIQTDVLGAGRRNGSVWRGNLVLEGHGDPDLTSSDLTALARQIAKRGIHRVSGRIVGDESYFDSRMTGPGWKPSYYKLECPPLSALVVDRAWLDGKTWDDPALAAAIVFKRALERVGVRVGNAAGEGNAPAQAKVLASTSSPTLAALVDHMNTESDNFYGEMLLKELGARELDKGTTAAGAKVVRQELDVRGVPLASVRVLDGSGLSDGDRLTAHALAAILSAARMDASLAHPFEASLAVAGVNGTLEDRMRAGPARGHVRAKTGTTDEASALAGYADYRFIFALVMNGDPVNEYAARRAQDRFATILAGAR